MYSLADNTRGAIYILDGWDPQTHSFTHVIPYLQHLRNPNNVAFYTDDQHPTWLYVPLTDRLLRYKYIPGDNAPHDPPQVLVRFPDYGLNYKYGGWHLTRTVAVARLHGRTRIYITTGSSCNYCRERESVRASLVAMDPDGTHQQLLAHGLRNAVDLRYIPNLDGGALFATNMGDDHLGDKLPEDTFFKLKTEVKSAPNYGWPTCYFSNGKPVLDKTPLPTLRDARYFSLTDPAPSAHAADSVYGKQNGVAVAGTNLSAGGGGKRSPDPNADLGHAPAPLKSCAQVPGVYTSFAARSSPLGFEYFPHTDDVLSNSFLVALHGASHPGIGTGYRVVQFTPSDRKPHDFITGFLTIENGKPVVHGRPCGILRLSKDTFLLSDDYLGLIYYIHPKAK